MAHRYWRLWIDRQNVNTRVAVTTLELRTSLGGAQAATGGTALSSGDNSTNVAANAFDTNTATFWEASAVGVTNTPMGDSDSGVYIGYDFGTTIDITDVYMLGRTLAQANGVPTRAWIEFSDNGSTWTKIGPSIAPVYPVGTQRDWLFRTSYATYISRRSKRANVAPRPKTPDTIISRPSVIQIVVPSKTVVSGADAGAIDFE